MTGRVSLRSRKSSPVFLPIVSVVLTPHHFHEHAEHVGYFTDHFVTKGAEVARALATTTSSLQAIAR